MDWLNEAEAPMAVDSFDSANELSSCFSISKAQSMNRRSEHLDSAIGISYFDVLVAIVVNFDLIVIKAINLK